MKNLLCCLFLLISSCVSLDPPSNRSLRNAAMLGRYKRVQSRDAKEALESISRRLNIGGDKIILVRDDGPLAFSTSDGAIVVSDRLIRSLSNEAELAFIVAHEFGHISLSHFSRPKNDELEMAADSFAVRRIVGAGYDPRPSIGAALHFYEGSQERVRNLEKTIRATPWLGIGIVQTRDFLRLRQAV